MLISVDAVTARATEIYRERKHDKGQFATALPSDQIHAIIQAFVEVMNHELMNQVVLRITEDEAEELQGQAS